MAEEQLVAEVSVAAPAARPKISLLLVLLVGATSAVAGFGVTQFLGKSADRGADETAGKSLGKQKIENGTAAVPFGEVVANLDDTRMMRYVRARFSLSVDKRDAQVVQQLVEVNKTVMKNWLIGYLQNKQIEEVRGTEGFNRIRREIQERFNQMLFPGEEPKIKEVLFDEFNVQ